MYFVKLMIYWHLGDPSLICNKICGDIRMSIWPKLFQCFTKSPTSKVDMAEWVDDIKRHLYLINLHIVSRTFNCDKYWCVQSNWNYKVDFVSSWHSNVRFYSVCLWLPCFSEDDVACELTTGTVLCGSVSRALKHRKSESRKTATHQSVVCVFCLNVKW